MLKTNNKSIDANTKLLLHLDITQKKFGIASISCDGKSDYMDLKDWSLAAKLTFVYELKKVNRRIY